MPDLSVEEVAARLSVHRETVRRWLRTGELRGYRLGFRGGWRIPEEELRRFIRSRQNYKDQQ